jgi:hypothetical protein
MEKVDEIRDLRDLLFRESADLFEEVLFLKRITPLSIVTLIGPPMRPRLATEYLAVSPRIMIGHRRED